MGLKTNDEPIDTAAVFDQWIRLAYPELITVCGVQLAQVDVLLASAPLAYVSMYQEWLAQEVGDGHFISYDGGATYCAPILWPRAVALRPDQMQLTLASSPWGASLQLVKSKD